MNNSEYIENFLKFLREIKSDYNFAEENLRREDGITQDLLHSLELDNLRYKERSKIATKLAENRRNRRYYKDVVEELKPIYDFLNANKSFVDRLTQTLGEVRRQEKYHSDRTYIPRAVREKEKADKSGKKDE